MQVIGIRVQVPGSSSSWEEEEVLYLPLLNCSQLMESELTGSLHVVLEWLNCKHQIPISTTPRPGASGMLWVVSFLRAMPHLMGCWMAATAACSHEEDAWRSAIYFHFSSPPHYCVFLASHLYSHWQSECWGVLLGQGSPCSGQGGGRPGWCPRALAGLCAPASLPCSWGRHSHPVQLGTHCSSYCPAPWCTAPPARKSSPSAASARPCRDGATCASAHWSVSLCCCTEGLGSASQLLVGREGLINGKCVLEFTLN